MKFLGIVVIVAACSIFGWQKSQETKTNLNRVLYLADLMCEFARLLRESALTVREICTRLCGSEKYGRFKFVAYEADEPLPPGEVIARGFKALEDNPLLTSGEAEDVANAFSSIEGLDPAYEAESLLSCAARLREGLKDREAEIRKKVKLNLMLWPLCGCAAAVILL